MVTVAIVVGVVAVAGLIAWIINSRRPDAPTTPQVAAPQQLDRADFSQPDSPWLLLLFSSETCLSCADARRLVETIDVPSLAVQDVPFESHKELHERYGVDAVPIVLLGDSEGVVRWSFLGPPPAGALAAALEDAGLVEPDDGTAVSLG